MSDDISADTNGAQWAQANATSTGYPMPVETSATLPTFLEPETFTVSFSAELQLTDELIDLLLSPDE